MPRQKDLNKKSSPTALQKVKVDDISNMNLEKNPELLVKSSHNDKNTIQVEPPSSLLLPDLADNSSKCSDISPSNDAFLSSAIAGVEEIGQNGMHNEKIVQDPKSERSVHKRTNEAIVDKERKNRKTPTEDVETKNVTRTSKQHVNLDNQNQPNHYMNGSQSKRYRSNPQRFSGEAGVMKPLDTSKLHSDFRQDQTLDHFPGSRSRRNASIFRGRHEYSSRTSDVDRRAYSQQKDKHVEDIKNNKKVSPHHDPYNHALGSPAVSIEERQHQLNHGSPSSKRYRNTSENSSPNPPQILRVHTNNLSDAANFFERSPGNTSVSMIVKKHSRKGSIGIDMAPSMLLFNNSFDDSLSTPDLGVFSLDRNTFNVFSGDLGSPKNISSHSRDKNFSNPSSVGERDRSSRAPFPSQGSHSMSIIMIGGSSSNSLSPRDEFPSGLIIGDSPSVTIRKAHNEGTPPGNHSTNPSSRYESHFPKADIVGKSIYGSSPEYDSQVTSREIQLDSQSKTVSPPERIVTSKKEVPNFYFILRKYRKAFSQFTFILPGLRMPSSEFRRIKSVDTLSLDLSYKKDFQSSADKDCTKDDRKAAFMPEPSMAPTRAKNSELSPSDVIIVRRRLAATVCLFGGTIGQKSKRKRNQSNVSSIFRRQCEIEVGGQKKTSSQIEYEQQLPMRYYENENRLSWEVEEFPPVEVVTDDEDSDFGKPFDIHHKDILARKSKKRTRLESHDSSIKPIPSHIDSGMVNHYPLPYGGSMKSRFGAESPTPVSAMGIITNCGEAPKMKYRCKLCGQPKQNHTCPYTQSLQRSIGTMSFASTNAYNADEPGKLSLRLSDMNNFTINEEGPFQSKKSKSTTSMDDDGQKNISTVENSSKNFHRISQSPRMTKTTTGSQRKISINDDYCLKISEGKRRTAVYSAQKRPSSQDTSHDKIFQKTMEIKEEQYRTITPTNNSESSSSYKYPPLPLTYGQRKRLSDSLFSLSKEVTGLTDECADILREARETDMWDLAIAELLTQVLVIIHCPENDNTLNGLQQYLLTLGVAC